MKNGYIKLRKVIGLILATALLAAIFIYFSDYNLSSHAYTIIISFIVVTTLYLSCFFPGKLRAIGIVITIITGIIFFLLQWFNDFVSGERVIQTWEISNYEVVNARNEYLVGPGDGPYLVLRKKFIYGMFYKNIEKTEIHIPYLKIGKTDCVITFPESKKKFDLCEKKEIP